MTEFRYCMKLAWGINDYGQLGGLIDYGWGMARDDRAFVFVDNHDNQRGHGGAGDVITHKTPREYKQAVSYMLAHPYGFTQVMSSYYFDNSDVGPPHNEDYRFGFSLEDYFCIYGNGLLIIWVVALRMLSLNRMAAVTVDGSANIAGIRLQRWYASVTLSQVQPWKTTGTMAEQCHFHEAIRDSLLWPKEEA